MSTTLYILLLITIFLTSLQFHNLKTNKNLKHIINKLLCMSNKLIKQYIMINSYHFYYYKKCLT